MGLVRNRLSGRGHSRANENGADALGRLSPAAGAVDVNGWADSTRCADGPSGCDVFDLYTESAKESLFWARSIVSRLGSDSLRPEHVVLGILDSHPSAIERFAASPAATQVLSTRLVAAGTGQCVTPEEQEIAFSQDAVDALQHARAEADAMSHRMIRPEHLVFGVCANTASSVAVALRDAGIRPADIRTFLGVDHDQFAQEPPERGSAG